MTTSPGRKASDSTGVIDDAGARLGALARTAGADVSDARATQIIFDITAGGAVAGRDDPMLAVIGLLSHQRSGEGSQALERLIRIRSDLKQAAKDTHVEGVAAAALASARALRTSLRAEQRAGRGETRRSDRGAVAEMAETLLGLGVVESAQVARRAARAVLTSTPMADADLEVIQGLGDPRYHERGLMPAGGALLADVIDMREEHRGLAGKETVWAAGRLQDAGTGPAALVRSVPWFTWRRFNWIFAKAPVGLPEGLYPGDPWAVYLAAAGRLAHSSDALRGAENVRVELIKRILRGNFPGLVDGRTRRQENIQICALFRMSNPTAVDYWRSRLSVSAT